MKLVHMHGILSGLFLFKKNHLFVALFRKHHPEKVTSSLPVSPISNINNWAQNTTLGSIPQPLQRLHTIDRFG